MGYMDILKTAVGLQPDEGEPQLIDKGSSKYIFRPGKKGSLVQIGKETPKPQPLYEDRPSVAKTIGPKTDDIPQVGSSRG